MPEAGQAGGADTPANALFAFGGLHAIGFSPFSIDTIDAKGAPDLGGLYAMLAQLTPLIVARRGSDRLWGARPPIAFDGSADLADQAVTMAGHRLTLRFIDPWTPRDRQTPEHHGALVMALGEGEYLVAGRGVTVTFAPADGVGQSGIERIEEGTFDRGTWRAGRVLNGDQSHQGRHLRLPPDAFGMQRVKLYRYR